MFILKDLNKKLFICAILLCIPNLNAEAVQMEAPSVTILQTENIDKKYTYRDAFLKTHEKTYSLKNHYIMSNTIELTTPTDNRTDNANKTTEKIEGRFERINSSSNGGAISNTGTGKIENINSDFILNSIYSETSKYGGAIYNKPSDKTTGITTIVGDFIHNEVYVYGNDYEEANGGAIFNNGTIQSITGDFLSNKAISDYNYGVGGAIYNEYNGTISSINGNFGYNQALGQYSQAGAIYNAGTINTINGDFYLNRIKGNDWNQGGAIRNSGEITTINGNFYLNQISGEDIARGGGIYNEGIIKDITGDFYNNLITVEASAPVPVSTTASPAMARSTINYGDGNALVAGGAIYNTYELDNIKGNFVNNKITAEASHATGGALTNTAQIKNIEGHFIENNINALNAQGGAISNTGEIGLISGDFVNNYVIGSSIAQGGAIYTTSGNNFGNADEGTLYYLQVNVVDADNTHYKSIYLYLDASYNQVDGNNIATLIKDGQIKNITLLQSQSISKEEYESAFNGSSEEDFLANNGYTTIGPNDFNFDALLDDTHTTLAEIQSLSPAITLKNSNLINNHADSTNGGAQGGAIYAKNSIVKFITDNGDTTVIAGNYTKNGETIEDNAIYLNNSKLIFEAKNGSTIQVEDKIDGTNYQTYIIGDNNSKFVLNNNIKNSNIELYDTNFYLGNKDNVLDGNNLTLNSGSFNMINNQAGVSSLNKLTILGNTNFTADVDLKNKDMDRFSASEYGEHTGTLNVVGMNLLSDAKKDRTEIYFAEKGLKDHVAGEITLPQSAHQTTLFSPIYKYNVSYDNRDDAGYFVFTRVGGSSSSSEAFNPAVFGSASSATVGAMSTMNNTFNYAFQNSENFMTIPYAERIVMKMRNRYALAIDGDMTDTGRFSPLYQPNNEGASIWVKPYTTFENVPLRNGPKVDNISYGTLIGFDTEMETLNNGFDRVWTGYIGYNGASQSYSGTDSVQNGGLIGSTYTLYKDNFFNATTLSVGASVSENKNMYGSEDLTMLLGGIGNKTGYNIEFKDGRIILQPSMFVSYTFVKTFDYTNAAGVNIENKPTHSIQLIPGMKLIGNTKHGWQPYVGVSMVWNLMGKNDTTANGIKLPEMCIKPYVQYGVGIQKRFEDNFMAFGQAMIQNGGRNGISLTGGMRWAIGGEKENNNNEKVKNKKDTNILKELTDEQKAEIEEKEKKRKLKKAMK